MKKLLNEKTKMNKLAIASMALVGSVAAAAAQQEAADITASNSGDVGFENLFNIFESWLGGNLGKLLALIGFAGTFIVYMMTHKGSVLMIGIIISLLAGGMVGISTIFFNAGADSFSSSV